MHVANSGNGMASWLFCLTGWSFALHCNSVMLVFGSKNVHEGFIAIAPLQVADCKFAQATCCDVRATPPNQQS
jgi:hypothetical protein